MASVIQVPPGGDLQLAIDQLGEAGGTIQLPVGGVLGGKVFRRSFLTRLVIRGVVDANTGVPLSFISRGKGAGEGLEFYGCRNFEVNGLLISGMTYLGGARTFIAGCRIVACIEFAVRNYHGVGNLDWGVLIAQSHDWELEDNRYEGQKRQHGGYISDSSSNGEVRRCTSQFNDKSGFHNNGQADAFPPTDVGFPLPYSGTVRKVNYTDCVARGNCLHGGAEWNMDGLEDSVLKGCLISESNGTGLALYQADAARPATNITFQHGEIRLRPDANACAVRMDGNADVLTLWESLIEGDGLRADFYPPNPGGKTIVSNRNRWTCPDGKSPFGYDPDNEVNVMTVEEWQHQTGNDRDSVFGPGPAPPNTSPAPLPAYYGSVEGNGFPDVIPHGEVVDVHIDVMNKGSAEWDERGDANVGGSVRMGIEDENFNWLGNNRLKLDPGVVVRTGQVGRFKGKVRGIASNRSKWRQVVELVGWKVANTTISVTVPLTANPAPWAEVVGGGQWKIGERGVCSHELGYADPRKVFFSDASEVTGRVMTTVPLTGLDRLGLSVGQGTHPKYGYGYGYNVVFRPDGKLYFLNDEVVWGPGVDFPCVPDTWYSMRLISTPTRLYGRAWEDGRPEPQGWQLEADWPQRSGRAGYNGGCAAASFRPLG